MSVRRKSSTATGFILVVLVILVVGQGSLWTWFLFTQKKNAGRALRDKVEMAARFLADVSACAIDENDVAALKRHARGAVEDSDIISIRVLDADGKVLAHAAGRAEEASGFFNPFFVPSRSSLSRPVFADGQRLGTLEVFYSGQRVNDFMTGLLTVPPLVQVLVFLAIIYAIYFFFQRTVGSPIMVLQDIIRRVTAGDLSTEIPDMGSNEFGEIADGLNFLVERLRAGIKRLNATARSVAKTTEYLRGMFDNSISLVRKHTISLQDMAASLKNAVESQARITGSTGELASLSRENSASLREVKATADENVASMEILSQATENSFSVAAQMSQISESINSVVQKVLSSVDDTSASVEEVMASLREVEKNAKESSSLAEEVKVQAARDGINTVADAIRRMEKISGKVEFSAEMVKRLEARSGDIEKIIAVIREVTEKTNLLSINASILAEQAGEFGSGFSVVAEEMRGLSGRTASHATEIAGIVKTIQSEVREVVAAITEGEELVKEGREVVYRVGETMNSIMESSRQSAAMAGLIERATEDQAGALRHIESSVVDMNRMALEMSRAMEEQRGGCGFILERVSEMRETAETTRRGTEEQARETDSISNNLELANEKLAGINESVSLQQEDHRKLISASEELKEAGMKTLKDVEGVSYSLSKLQDEIDLLRKEMEMFHTGPAD